MKKTQMYEAADGSQFSTAIECKKYESATYFKKLANLTEADIGRAIRREDTGLAAAFERVGNMIAGNRRASGELKRNSKNMPAGQTYHASLKPGMQVTGPGDFKGKIVG